MKIYEVGGAVRDALLGLPVKDRDFVVVGATPGEMERRGFRAVGKDFPVFLHPQTHEEYALARTERKSGRGYKGFTVHAAPEVTLEQDLARRDLTINAIARDEAGNIIDPHGGARDLRAGVLRHVSDAFVEDPVRLLRVARFAARLGFAIAPETLALMRAMVDNGEVDALVPERVWQELSRGLMERDPVRMIDALEQCGAMLRVLPQWRSVDAAHARRALAHAARGDRALPVRYASLLADAPVDAVAAVGLHLRAPNECAEVAEHVARYGHALASADSQSQEQMVELLQRVDAFRRSERFDRVLEAIEALCVPAPGDVTATAAVLARWRTALAAANAIDAGAIAKAHAGNEAAAIRQARISAVAQALRT